MTPDELLASIEQYRLSAYRDGFAAGIAVAEQIVSWLHRIPDTQRQRETREWAGKLIEKKTNEVFGRCKNG